jgi:hypothetical protein
MFMWQTYNQRTQVYSFPNLDQTVKAIEGWKRYSRVYGVHFRLQEQKAQAILEGQRPLSVLKGPKVRAFYHCIAYPDSEQVCIDRWAWRVASDKPYRSGFQLAQLQPVMDAYRKVATQLGEQPCAVQAGTWLNIRKEA